MSVISKDLASQIAYKLTVGSKQKVDAAHADYMEAVTELYEQQIPQDVKDCFSKNPDWFYTRGIVSFEGFGFRWENVSTKRGVIANSGTSAHLKLTGKSAEKLTAIKRKWEKEKANYEELKEETKNALLALKTYNNIRKELPLASPLLPPPMSNALVCNFDSLKKRLTKQPEVVKVEA